MIVIISATLIATLLANLSSSLYTKSRGLSNAFFLLTALVLFLPVAFRGMGVDYGTYKYIYNSIAQLSPQALWASYTGKTELGYVVLNYVAARIFGCFQGVNVLCAALTIIPMFWALNKFRSSISLGCTIFSFGFSYYLFLYGLNRMMIAVAFGFCAFVAYTERKRLRYFLFALVAIAFHYSAFILLALYFLLKWLERNSLVSAFGSLKRLIGFAIIMVAIVLLFPRIASSFGLFLRYKNYFTPTLDLAALNNSAPFYPLFLILPFYSSRLRTYLGEADSFVMLAHLLILFTIMGVFFGMHRLCYYFFPAAVVLYGAVPKTIVAFGQNDKLARDIALLYVMALFVFGALWIVRMYVAGDQLWLPNVDPYVLGTFSRF